MRFSSNAILDHQRLKTCLPKKDQQGSVMVEVAITILPFLIIILASLHLLIICYNTVTLQYVTARVGRWVSVGDVGSGSSRSYPDIVARFQNEMRRIGLDETTASIKICPQDNPNCSGQAPGAARQLMVLTATKECHSVIDVMDIEVTASVLLRNEAF